MSTMDVLSAAPGDKIVFAHPLNGYAHDQKEAAEYLLVGNIYTIDTIEVGGWSTSLTVKEVPGRRFNSVHFDAIDQTTTD